MKTVEQNVIDSIRVLSADQIQKANSGHPGTPLGAAPQAFVLWDRVMNYNAKDPKWSNRDRYVLSAGHASSMLYSLLHLYGFGLTIDDLKSFRQVGSKTPGHPEFGHTTGVETTTGPLGQGVANAVGFALAEAYLAAKFNRPGFPVVDHYTYVMCGDGCIMEGIASEASSIAGTLKLGKLILLYDANKITIEGSTDLALTEDVKARYEAYGWHTQVVEDGTDYEAITKAVLAAKEDDRPSFIMIKSIIGHGCPAKAGKANAHGEPLGVDNLVETKKVLGMPAEAFTLPDGVYEHTAAVQAKGEATEEAWNKMFAAYRVAYPELAAEWDAWHSGMVSEKVFDDADLWAFDGKAATRNCSNTVLNKLAAKVDNLIGGSADLGPANKTVMKARSFFSAEDRTGSNLHFGVREHAMAAISNAMALHGGLLPYCATFLTFSDYMKNAIRLSAMMKLPVTYVFSHDSIGVGEDGPTHQPIEHLTGLRSIPGLLVFRPADGKETVAAWETALTDGRPTCVITTRQDLPQQENSGKAALRGGYVLSAEKGAKPDVLLMASGSEVAPMMEAQQLLWEKGVDARVISMPCMELFNEQDVDYRESVIPSDVRVRVAMEAGATMPWFRYVGLDGKVIGLDHYGASAPFKELFPLFGITAEHAAEEALALLKK